MTISHLEESLDQACALGRAVLLNLEATTYLDGRGIGVIDRAAHRLMGEGQGFVLVGSLPAIHKLLKLCFQDEVHLVGTVDEGLSIPSPWRATTNLTEAAAVEVIDRCDDDSRCGNAGLPHRTTVGRPAAHQWRGHGGAAKAVELVVGEALTNVFVHAYDETAGPVHVAIAVKDRRMTVSIRDEGPPVPDLRVPYSQPERGDGFGLFVIGQLLDEVRVWWENGMTIRMAIVFP